MIEERKANVLTSHDPDRDISVNLRASIEDPTSHLVYAQPHLRALSLYLGVSLCTKMVPVTQLDLDSNTWRYKCDSAEVLTLNTYMI